MANGDIRFALGLKPMGGHSNSYTTEAALARLEDYCRFEVRLSHYNVLTTVKNIRLIMKAYNVTSPSVNLAKQIERDMIAKGRSRFTIKTYLHGIEYWAWSQGFAKNNFKLSKPKTSAHRVDYLTKTEVRKLLKATADPLEYAIVMTLIYTGLRNKELRNLDLEDLDLENRILHVRDRGEGIKNFQESSSVLSRDCAKAIKVWLNVRPRVDSQALFVSLRTKRRFKQHGLEVLINRVGKRAEIERSVYPHLLRHTCGTHMASSGINIAHIKRQLRHNSINSTMIYVNVDLADLRKNIDEKLKF